MIRLIIDKPKEMEPRISKIHKEMHKYKTIGNDFLGWLEQPNKIDYLEDIKETVSYLDDCDVMLVLGVGGSFLGTKMAYNFLRREFSEDKLFFAGYNLSRTYAKNLKTLLEGKKVALVTISKSGKTLETAEALNYFEDIAYKNIVVTGRHSELWRKAEKNKWKIHELEKTIGGRYSFLTSVCLLPLAFAGYDIKKIIEGQKIAYKDMMSDSNIAYQYANERYNLAKKYQIELFAIFEPKHQMIAEWIKQLFGESEGKEKKGLFPASVVFSTDLHSLGQFIQQGPDIMFETFIRRNDERGIEEINEAVYLAAKKAHVAGGKTVIQIEFDKNSEETLGYFTYFMFKAAAMSAYLFGVNPFDQPGVEMYKKEIRKIMK